MCFPATDLLNSFAGVSIKRTENLQIRIAVLLREKRETNNLFVKGRWVKCTNI